MKRGIKASRQKAPRKPIRAFALRHPGGSIMLFCIRREAGWVRRDAPAMLISSNVVKGMTGPQAWQYLLKLGYRVVPVQIVPEP